MNYYERHLGDYARDTAHLSMLEHGAYSLLLDRYYATEQGIPADQAHRLARARTREEKQAVDAVLEEFFTLQDGAWTNARAEEEIAKYIAKQPEADKRRENDKERQRRARERRKAMFAELDVLGVRMPWNATTDELQAELDRATSQSSHAPVTPPVTRDNTATRHQAPDTSKPFDNPSGSDTVVSAPPLESPPPAARDAISIRATEMAVLLRHRGAALQASDPIVRRWAESGVTDAQALSALETAQERRATAGSAQQITAAYLNPMVQDQRAPPGTASGKPRGSRTTTVHDQRRAAGIAIFGNLDQQQERNDERVIDASTTPAARAALER